MLVSQCTITLDNWYGHDNGVALLNDLVNTVENADTQYEELKVYVMAFDKGLFDDVMPAGAFFTVYFKMIKAPYRVISTDCTHVYAQTYRLELTLRRIGLEELTE